MLNARNSLFMINGFMNKILCLTIIKDNNYHNVFIMSGRLGIEIPSLRRFNI